MNKDFTISDILAFEQRYRATFINSLGGFKSLALIGTRGSNGNTNLAVFNSLFHIGANPPLFGFMIRPDSVERHTLNNIYETGSLTVNHVNEDFYMAAHQTSARYDASISEFSATELTEEYKAGYYAPFVKESSIKLAADFVQKVDIQQNATIMIIAKIKYVSIPPDCIMNDGFIDIEKAGTITCAGVDSYHSTKKIARLSYAKSDKWTEKLV